MAFMIFASTKQNIDISAKEFRCLFANGEYKLD